MKCIKVSYEPPTVSLFLNSIVVFIIDAAVHDCEQYEEDGFMFFQCNIKPDMSTLETWGSAMMDLRNRLVDFQTQTDKIVDLLSLRSTPAVNQSTPAEPKDAAPPPLVKLDEVYKILQKFLLNLVILWS